MLYVETFYFYIILALWIFTLDGTALECKFSSSLTAFRHTLESAPIILESLVYFYIWLCVLILAFWTDFRFGR